MDLQNKVTQLLTSQEKEWEQLKKSVSQLDYIKEKTFNWGDEFNVKIQFNPARITSTAAIIDKKHIEKRPCFLCEGNRPAVQRGIQFLDKYIILANPFPILKNHLTIPLHSHVPQLIRNKVPDMLKLAEQLPDYVIFYNGPKSGASAPDHFHFQAGLKQPELLQGDNELRSCLVIEGSDIEDLLQLFEEVYQFLHSQQPQEEEPMINVIAFYENNNYKIHIFSRRAHRPRQYYEEEGKKMLVSPGALDMAGLIITVREEDFNKINKQDIQDIYSQVSMPII